MTKSYSLKKTFHHYGTSFSIVFHRNAIFYVFHLGWIHNVESNYNLIKCGVGVSLEISKNVNEIFFYSLLTSEKITTIAR